MKIDFFVVVVVNSSRPAFSLNLVWFCSGLHNFLASSNVRGKSYHFPTPCATCIHTQSIYREFCGVDQWRKYVFYALIGFRVERRCRQHGYDYWVIEKWWRRERHNDWYAFALPSAFKLIISIRNRQFCSLLSEPSKTNEVRNLHAKISRYFSLSYEFNHSTDTSSQRLSRDLNALPISMH